MKLRTKFSSVLFKRSLHLAKELYANTIYFIIFFLPTQFINVNSFAQNQINYSPTFSGITYIDEKVINADINHDGNLDIILYKSSSGLVTALKHNGNNNANGMQFGSPFSVSITSESLIDVKNINDNNVNNTDQEADLITYKAGVTYDQIYYYKSDGFSFSSGVLISNNSLPHANYQFGTFDIDNDGDFDIYALDKANSLFYYGIVNNLTVTFSLVPNFPAIPANATVHIFSGHFQSAAYKDICYVVEYPNNPANSNYNFQVLKNNNGISLSVDFNSTDNNVSPNRQFFAGKFTTDNFTDIAIYESGSAMANINGYIDVQSNVAGTMFSVSANHWQSGLTPPNNASFLVNAGNYSANSSYDDMIFLETSATLAPANLGNSYLDINTENNSTFTLSLPLGIAPCNANPIAPNLSTDFHIVNGDFNQDNIADFVLYNPTDHVIKTGILTTPPVPNLDGYCWPLSAAPSETIDFFISGTPLPGTVDIYRYESRNASVDAIYVTSLALQGGLIPDQTANTNSNAVQDGCGWNSTVSLNIPNGWLSGYYAAVVTNSNCARTSINFIVKSAPNDQSGKKLLLLANTNTWAAYNTYTKSNQAGSKYGEGNVSKYQDYSFMRPVSNNNIASNDNTNGARAELWIYTWLKDNGYDPDVVTDMDVHVNAGNFLNTYDYLVMGTHPEYWTGPMYDHVKDFQANGAGGNGGNLICLGGNAVFEVVDIDLSNAANPKLIAYPNNPAGPVTPNTVPQQNAQYPFLYLGQLLANQVGGLQTSSPFLNPIDYYHDRFDYFLESYNFGAPGGPIVNKRSIDLIGTHYMNLAAYAAANANTNASYTKANIVTPLFNGVVGVNGTIGYDGYSTHYGVVASGGMAAGWECDRYTTPVAPFYNPVYPQTFNNLNLSPYTPASPLPNPLLPNPASIYANDILVIASTTPNQYSNPQIVTLPDNSDLFLPNGMNNSEIIYVRPTCIAPNKHGFVFTAGSICFGGSLVWNYDLNTNTYNNDLSRLLLNVLNHINFDANISNVTCSGGNTGSIVITQPALYAANSITYSLSGNSPNTTGIFTNLAAGTYQLTISIPNGNLPITLCREYTISEPPPIVLSASATNATCNGTNGLLTFTASGGTGNISFTINGVAQNSPFPAPAGIYTIIATDANNCIQSTTITIVQPVAINIGISNLIEPTCNGLCNATAQATASGGIFPYTYTISAPGTINANTGAISGLCAGAYTLTATDANGCSATSVLNINQPNILNVSISNINNVSCNGLCNATAQATASGGTTPYLYTITAPGLINANTGAISGLCAGAYTLTASDANGCNSTSVLNISQPTQLLLTIIQVDNPPCALANGSISFAASGGTGIIGFTANGNPTGSPFIAPAGSYTIIATDANGCTQSTVVILQNTGIIVNAIANPNVICAGDQSVLTASGANSYTWQPGNLSGAAVNVTPASSTIYTVTGSIGPCTATATVLVEVHNTGIVCCNPSLFYNPSSIHYADVSTSTIGAGFYNVNTPILLDGVITVDNNFTISFCTNIKMGPGATIVLQPNITLTVDNSNISAACNEMWQGIVATDASEQVNITNSEISDMLGGVLVSNGAKIHSENTHYIDNLTGIYFANTPSNYAFPVNNGVVIKNTFTSSGNNLLPPSTQSKPETGIRIVNCGSVTIGELVTGSHNFFSNIYTGIHINSYNIPTGGHLVNVLNNQFLEIKDDYSANTYPEWALANAYYSSSRGAAVMSECTGLPITSGRQLHVESVYNDGGFFRCDKAVVTNSVSCNAYYNIIDECTGGFLFNEVMGQNYKIRANDIKNVFNAVQFIGDAANILVYDHQNNISNTARISLRELPIQTGINTYEWPRGVDIRGVNNKHTGLVDVYNNQIVQNGIGGIGILLGLTGPNSFARHNTVQMSTADATPNPEAVLTGIYSFGTYSSHVNCNTVNGLSGAVFGVRNSTAVMNYESGRMEVACNFVNYTHRGFFNVGDCSTGPKNVRGNLHFNHIQGWLFANSVFNHEGTWGDIGISGSLDNNNQFFGLYLNGFNVYRWFINAQQNVIHTSQNIISGSNIGVGYIINPTPNPVSCGNTCNSNYYPMVALDSMINVNEAIELASDTTILPFSMSTGEWMAIRRLYEELVLDSVKRVSNPILENFYTMQQQTNIKRFYATDIALQALTDSNSATDSQLLADRISAAHAANNSISNPQGYEWNEQWVNELFIRSIEFGTDSLTEAELLQLEWLAKSCPAIEGTAVWKARSLYSRYEPVLSYDDYTICVQSPAYKQTQQDVDLANYLQGSYLNAMEHNMINKVPLIGVNEVKAYPNPAQDMINIAYRFEKGEGRILQIYDLVGRKIWEQKLQASSATVPINCIDWVAGIYHFVIKSKTENYTGKIQIQR